MSKNKTCSFIGHRKTVSTPQLEARLETVIKELIEKNGVTVFLFGSKSRFDDLCLAMITKLKERYPFIKRVYVRSMYPEIEKFYEKYILESYDETYMPKGVEKAGRAAYVERNQAMIDGSDFCVFYYDENYRPEKRKSGTRIAYEYAKKKGKKIYNVYEG